MLCRSCKRELDIDQFAINKSGHPYVTCDTCRQYTKRELIERNDNLIEITSRLSLHSDSLVDTAKQLLKDNENLKRLYKNLLAEKVKADDTIKSLESVILSMSNVDQDECDDDKCDSDHCPTCLTEVIEGLESRLDDIERTHVRKKTHLNKIKKIKANHSKKMKALSMPPKYSDIDNHRPPPPYST